VKLLGSWSSNIAVASLMPVSSAVKTFAVVLGPRYSYVVAEVFGE
jgi:hypothetical protein